MPTVGKFPVLERQVGKMVNYWVGDFCIRMKNAAMSGQKEFRVPETKMVRAVANVFKKEKYLDSVTLENNELICSLSYRKKQPILLNLKLVSKPGLRIYKNVDELSKHKGASWLIISTSKGLKSLKDALKQGMGGEVIVEVW